MIKKFALFQLIFLCIGLLLFCSSVYLFSHNYGRLHTEYSDRQKKNPNMHRPYGTGNNPDISIVRAWMTFDYINKMFHIPDTYLQTTLAIDNKKYPRITVKRLAQEQGKSVDQMLKETKDQIHAFLINK